MTSAATAPLARTADAEAPGHIPALDGVRGLLRGFGLRLALAPRAAGFAALVGATLFALHPVQTEAVTYVSGRSSSLSTLFALLALAAWLRGLDAPDERRWRWISCAVFALALGVKEAPVALPLVMAAWLLATGAARSIPRRLAPHLGLLLGAALVLLAWPPYRALLMASLDARPVGLNLLTQVNAVVYLLGQMLRLDGMNADPALAVVVAADAALWLRATLLVALAGILIRSARDDAPDAARFGRDARPDVSRRNPPRFARRSGRSGRSSPPREQDNLSLGGVDPQRRSPFDLQLDAA